MKVTLKQAKVTVTTAGTRVQFTATDTHCTWVRIRALTGNVGAVYVGDSTVAASTGWTLYESTFGGENDLVLEPGHRGYTLNLATLYADADNNGDAVEYVAEVL